MSRFNPQKARLILEQAWSHRAEVPEVLRDLPDGLEPELVASAAHSMFAHHPRWAHYTCSALPAEVIRPLLDRLDDDLRAELLVIRAAVDAGLDDRALVSAWKETLQSLADLAGDAPFGSQGRRAAVAAVAGRPRVVEGLRAAAVKSPWVKLDWLAALAIDGREESLDALLPHVERALRDPELSPLQRLARLREHADGPPVRAMLERIDHELAKRHRASKAVALGKAIGLGTLEQLWFTAQMGSSEHEQHWPLAQVAVNVSSGSIRWFHVAVHRRWDRSTRSTAFDDQQSAYDQLGIGRCAPEALPKWLRQAAEQLKCHWSGWVTLKSNLRGHARGRLIEWLQGR